MGRGIAIQRDDPRRAPLCLQRLAEEGFRRRDITAGTQPEINGVNGGDKMCQMAA